MNRLPTTIIFFTLIAIFSATPFSLSAQVGVPAGVEPLILEISPQFPGAYSEATLRVRSTLLDLSRGHMTVTQNGNVIREGSGNVSIPFTTGRSGSPVSLTVRATIDGAVHTGNITFTPADLTLFYEADSYVPSTYQGKRLPPPDGKAKIIAVPDFRTSGGSFIPSNQILYTWKVDGRTLFEESGIGRDSIEITIPTKYRSRTIQVLAATRDGSISMERSMTLTPSDPRVRMYIFDPLVGVRYEQAIMKDTNLIGEATLIAEPFHFSASDRGSETLTYQWRLNNVTVPGEITPRLTLRNTSGQDGTASIDVRVLREGMPFQLAQHFFQVFFRAQ